MTTNDNSRNYTGTRRSNFVKPAEQKVVDFDPATITPANPHFKVNFVKIVDFGAKGVTIDVLGLIGNMHYSFKLGDAAMRLSGASVKAWVDKLALPRSSSAKDEAWTTSDTTGDAYRLLTFGSKQPAAGGSAFDETPVESAF
jgi:hypothetical protein